MPGLVYFGSSAATNGSTQRLRVYDFLRDDNPEFSTMVSRNIMDAVRQGYRLTSINPVCASPVYNFAGGLGDDYA